MKNILKKGWVRTILYFLCWIASLAIVFILLTLIFKLLKININFFSGSNDITTLMLGSVIQAMVTLGISWIFCKYIEKRPFSVVGLNWKNPDELLIGSLLGIVLISFGSVILMVLGLISLENFNPKAGLLIQALVMFIAVAINEEVMARGNILRTLMDSMGKYWALAVSALIFSLLHGFNPEVSFIGLANIFLAGILLGVYYIHTRNLWLPIGLHLTWNFFQGPVWGYSVSGESIKGMVSQQLVGSDLWTGGKFGFEASLLCTLIMVVSIVGLEIYGRKNKVEEKTVDTIHSEISE